MKAAVLTGFNKMEIRELPTPEIRREDEVLLEVQAVGVCGSDVHYYTEGKIGSQVVEYPYRVGHECSARVADTGPGVKTLRKDDLVAVDPATPCGTCDQCSKGRENTCRNLTFLGTPGQGEGCLCEYITMQEKTLFCTPAGMTAEMAALVEPLSIGVYSVGLSSLRENEKIGILGSGPIGLSVLVSALDRGAQRAYVTDPIPNRLETASRAGACWTGNPHEEDIVARIEEQEPLLLDTVFECSGEQEALDQAVDLLKPGGKLVVVGIPELDRVSFSIDKIRRKELCIQNVRRQNNCVRKAIDLLDRNPEYADLIISHHFRLSEAVKAFDLVRNYEDGVIKAIIKP